MLIQIRGISYNSNERHSRYMKAVRTLRNAMETTVWNSSTSIDARSSKE